ncbi:hypothetical protein [Larkinella humicola]|uniref:YD repeat-containing protein n=1 Tax=Larkinella humicola TaxID=2607654 RepID=A0A5N1JBC4_9BACT|nr:hypothetical protein [Larkinella humicola]KAA9349084.1 hypothetical protein F0P93_22035 [Larkinella humicola]
MIHILRGVLYVWLAFQLTGCGDHLFPNVSPGSVPDRLRIKTVTQELADVAGRTSLAQYISTFGYDLQGRLNTITTTQNPSDPNAPVETGAFTYNAQNQVIQFQREITPAGESKITETYSYTYVNSQMTRLYYTNNKDGRGDNVWELTFQYNPNNKVKSSHKTFATGGVSYTEDSDYTFTGNNLTLVATATSIFRIPSSLNNSYTTHFTHDTKINPFYGTAVIPAPYATAGVSTPFNGILDFYTYYGGVDNVLHLSRNNVLSSGSITYAYTYVGDLPATRIKTEPFKPQETLTYGYESY